MDSLTLNGLVVKAGSKTLLNGVSLSLQAGRITALVGASGSGKSLTARACLGMIRASPGVVAGELLLEVDGVTHRPLTDGFGPLRGTLLAHLPQDSRGALDPLWTVRRHLSAVIRRQGETPGEALMERWLRRAGFEFPEAVLPMHPHALSGGMAQRVCIALALAQRARFLLADEPTTGLDPSVQQGILRQLARLRRRGMSVLLITHDLRLVPEVADEVLVMSGGRVVDQMPASALGTATARAARRLLTATARISAGQLPGSSPLPSRPIPDRYDDRALRARGLRHHYRQGLLRKPSPLPAIAGVDLRLAQGEVLGIIGESGSGKTTLALLIAGLLRVGQGSLSVLGRDLSELSPAELRRFRRRVQVLFQSPDAHLNPGMTVGQMLRTSARLHRPEVDPELVVVEALEQVGMADRVEALPHHLSGGERRRVGVARVLLAEPELIISDEPTSGLDAAMKAELLDLLLQSHPGRSHLIISHDLPMIAYATDRIAVMYAGRIIEEFPTAALPEGPHHPYTLTLLADAGLGESLPLRERTAEGRAGRGCPFRGPCPYALDACASIRPLFIEVGPSHRIACHAVGAS